MEGVEIYICTYANCKILLVCMSQSKVTCFTRVYTGMHALVHLRKCHHIFHATIVISKDRSIPLNINIITAKEIPTIPCVILGHIFLKKFLRYSVHMLHLYRTHAWCHVTQISNTRSPVASGNLFILPQLYCYLGTRQLRLPLVGGLKFWMSHQVLHEVLYEGIWY
jgi:hypothetical protein